MKLSKHAKTRTHQRGIPRLMVDLLERFGVEEKAADGARILFFDKTSRRRVKAYSGPLAASIEAFMDVYLIVEGGTVITTGHRTERIRRH